jgi:hypothetical protein
VSGVLLPLVAAAVVDGGQLVARSLRGPLHVAVPGSRGLTPTGRLRRGAGPVCGQHARLWRASTPDGRALCRRCAAHLERRTTPAQRQAAAATVRPDDLVVALENARTVGEVSELQILACNANLIARPVPGPGGPRPLHTVIHDARLRLLPADRRASRAPHGTWGPTSAEAVRARPRSRGARPLVGAR